MKICFIVGGNNIFFERYCEYLVSKGHDIHVIPLKMPEKKINKITYHDFGQLKAKRILSQIVFYVRVRRFVSKRLKPEIVSSFGTNQCGWLGAFTGWHPFFLHIMGSDILVSPFLKKILGYFAIKKADSIISESETIRNIASKYRNSDKNNHVIQFGVKLDLFKPNIDVRDLRKELNLKDGFVIISPRNNGPIYNHDIVIRAFSEILKLKPNCYLLLKAQDSDKKKELQKIAQEYGVLDKVRFFGFVPLKELPLYYNLADVFVSVPSSDSVPVTLQEAMACGVPPIVSDLPAVKEWVKDDVNGFVVPIRNAHALADAISKLLNSQEKKEQFIKYNFELVKSKSDFLKNMNEMELIYRKSI